KRLHFHTMFGKHILLTFLVIATILSNIADGHLHARFEENGITIDREEYLVDDSTQTCAAFTINNATLVPKPTNLRIQVPPDVVNNLTVTLIGTDLDCDHGFYVTPLSAAETDKWIGRWSRCSLSDTFSYEGKEGCVFQCQCSGSCEEIQILKMPRDILRVHDGCMFSTENVDNDMDSDRNIGRDLRAPWWYCSNDGNRLTGYFDVKLGVFRFNRTHQMNFGRMMIRPNQCTTIKY
ncbi:hypothetical protein LSH36_956g00000, partial [Paralvinella palmiformis]